MGSMTETGQLTKLDVARMRALRNGIYHSMRRSFYERWERILNFLVLALGTATAAELLNTWCGPNGTMVLGAMTAAVGAFQLVWGLGTKARDHAVLQGKFYSLVARAEAATGDAERHAAEIEKELSQLYGEETTTMYAVNALAYNAAQSANGRPLSTHLPVNWLERRVANVFAFKPDYFRPKDVSARPPTGDRMPHSA